MIRPFPIRLELIAMCAILTCDGADAKDGRTYYDAELMARVRQKIEKHDWAKRQIESAKAASAWLIKMSDQELWDFIPPPEQIRAINVHIAHDCPVCGDEITRKAGHYPWIIKRNKPFKLQCPVCKNIFPSNDFQPWNVGGLEGKPESGPGYIDKGLGWLGPDGRRYYFVPYYIFWQRWWRDILGGIPRLAEAYLLTDKPIYAHKCAVMLSKIASEYDRFDYANQAYHEGKKGIPGRISDRIWSTRDNSKIVLAFDAIFPALNKDEELKTFLKGKGLGDPRKLIESNMLFPMARDVMSGFVAGNMGAHQKTMCYLAIVLDNDDPAKGPTTEDMRNWLMSGRGRVEDLLWNGFWREGLGGESSPSYSSIWTNSFFEIAHLLPKLGVDIWSNPKLKKMADVGLDLTIAGEFCPSIGDCGSIRGTGKVCWSVGLQGPAFKHYKDPRHAKALKLMNASPKHLWHEYYDGEEVDKVVAEHGTDLGLKTRNLGGYGLAILESGKGENRRGVSMYYGDANGGHGHKDRLNIEMFAFGRPMLTENGYPTPFTRPNYYDWRGANTFRHYCVMIDEWPHRNRNAGDLNTLAESPEVHLMDGAAEITYPGVASLYRRTTVLVDISDEDSYLLDIFRVRGGDQHDWCFHGPPFPEFSVNGGELGPVQKKGTLAGEDVAYGARPPQNGGSCGFQGLFNVRRMRPKAAWSAVWRKPDEDLYLTMTMPAGCASEVITAVGEPELTPDSPDTIQYVLGRNVLPEDEGKAKDGLYSAFVAVIEPHQGEAKVTEVENLKGNTNPEAVGLTIRRGQTQDIIHSSLTPGEKCVWSGDGEKFEVAAEFALLTLDDDGVKRAVVVNGTLLRYGKFVLETSPSPEGKVLSVDHQANSITVDTEIEAPDACQDLVIILGNERQKTSYTIKNVEVAEGKTTLSFGDVLFIVGMGVVTSTDQAAGAIISDRKLAGYGRNDGGKHAGRWLYNEDKSRGFRIASINGTRIVLDDVNDDLETIFKDVDGDGRRLYWISDIGPGDTFRIPTTTYFAR